MSYLDFPGEYDEKQQVNEKYFNHCAVVANSEYCANIGKSILEIGGSAVDAAIAILLSEGINSMQNMGIGGGCYMVIYKHSTGDGVALDAREVAPGGADINMYNGKSRLNVFGPLAVAVPGELMGYWEAHKRYGNLPWKTLFEPAIKFCEQGVPVNYRLAQSLIQMKDEIFQSSSLRFLLARNGLLPTEKEIIKLPELAETLRIVANSSKGALELYDGVLTNKFIRDIQNLGGIITENDLKNYRCEWKYPIRNTFQNEKLKLFTMPSPGSGSILSFILSVLDGSNLLIDEINPNFYNVSTMVETFKYAYALRSELGDPNFVDIKSIVSRMENLSYVDDIRKRILNSKTKGTYNFPNWYGARFGGQNDSGTINVGVLAPNGDAVCVTSTINTLFGSVVASKQTGIILNNEMDDFSSPGYVNSFGISPCKANFIAPRKRPFSSMCPSIFVDTATNDVKLIIGAAGGSHITTAVTQVALNHLWFDKSIYQSIFLPRVHHQLLPMVVKYEPGISKDIITKLTKLGHQTQKMSPHSCVSAISKDKSGLIAATFDPRRGGSTAGF